MTPDWERRVVAIDGPGGSGKSTVARALAARLGVDHLDTGAMYRAVAWAALRQGIDPAEVDAVRRLAEGLDLAVDGLEVTVDGLDASAGIRSPEVTRAVSTVAANSGVRTELRRRQRAWAMAHDGGVVEGRDIGTVVFPEARLKVFLTDDPEVRAARRSREVDLDHGTVASDLARRDALDSARRDSPMRAAEDALVVDTGDRSVEEIVDDLVWRYEG